MYPWWFDKTGSINEPDALDLVRHVLRFRPESSRRRSTGQSAWSLRDRWRIVLLIACLGLVVAAMRQIQKPETVERLDQLFGDTEQDTVVLVDQSQDGLQDTVRLGPPAKEEQAEPQHDETEPPPRSAEDRPGGLEYVKDNTPFRSVEGEAWFGLFARLQQMSLTQLLQESLGQASYAQLLRQPEEYRARVVSLSGTVLREEEQEAPANDLGITTYHRLWLRPQGGGQWPLVVYCLDVPEQFPRGDGLRIAASVTGYFFKNWSYAYDDGLGVAPVVLAKGVQWQQGRVPSIRSSVSSRFWRYAAIVAVVIAMAVTWFVDRKTLRRTPRYHSSEEIVLPDEEDLQGTVEEQLARMSEGEKSQ